MIKIETTGSFNNIEKFLRGMSQLNILNILNKYGQKGVDALSNATPVDSGLTASSWRYETSYSYGTYRISWYNTHVVDGRPIAILLQYGHATGTGGYVQGRDYINPAIRPIFDQIGADVWRVVTTS